MGDRRVHAHKAILNYTTYAPIRHKDKGVASKYEQHINVLLLLYGFGKLADHYGVSERRGTTGTS